MMIEKTYHLSYIQPVTRTFRETRITALNANEAVKALLARDGVVGEVIVNVSASWRIKATVTPRVDLELVP